MARWMHLIFCSVWLASMLAFFVGAMDAHTNISTHLVPTPTQGKGVDVRMLDETIRSSARLSFWLNIMSGAAALLGLLAQIGAMIRDQKAEMTKRSNPLSLIAGVLVGLLSGNRKGL
jgi:hypothetical protein